MIQKEINTYFKHPQALVESNSIGEDTRVWAFAHILPGAKIGKDCNICDHVFIENEVVIGDRVTIKCGVQLWDRITVEDDVFIGPNVTFCNDVFPRSKQYPEQYLPTLIRRGASIGANATILPGITIESHAMIGAGAVVTKNVPCNAIVVGNPAKIIGYVNVNKEKSEKFNHGYENRLLDLPGNAKIIDLPPIVEDLRGVLAFVEFQKDLPFIPQRYFAIFDVPSHQVRGEHAHKTLHELLICIKGSCSVVLDDGVKSIEIQLDSPTKGLHIPPLVWGIQYKYSQDAILIVLASDSYKPEDYIRDYDEFKNLVKKH